MTLALGIGSSRPVGLAYWLIVIAAVAALEALAHRSPRIPSLEDLVSRHLATPLLRAGAIAIWLYAGWHLFAH